MIWKCNSCGATYPDPKPDGTPAFHVCSPDTIEQYAVTDEKGNVTQPEKRAPRASVRNENIRPGLVYLEGKPMLRERDPSDPTRWVAKPAESIIISEGEGRTAVEETEGSKQP